MEKSNWSIGRMDKKGYYAFRRTTGYSINNDAMLMADKSSMIFP
jgi:hypothetical protein